MDADGHNVEFDGGWTKCWAELQDGVPCSVATTDPLGLCPRHRAEIVGAGGFSSGRQGIPVRRD